MMVLDTEDKGISRDLLIYGIREPKATYELQKCIKSGMTVCEIGANIGYYALQEADLVGLGWIIAFEPVPSNIKLLDEAISINRVRNIELHEMAVGEFNGKINVNISANSNLCAIEGKAEGRDYKSKIIVPMITLDSFFAHRKSPDILRMDVEGFEFEIIKGSKELLKRGDPMIIFMEVHFDLLGKNVKPMLQILKDNGFKVRAAFVEAHQSVNTEWGKNLLVKLDRFINGKTPTLDDMFSDRFTSGQVEYMEVFFER